MSIFFLYTFLHQKISYLTLLFPITFLEQYFILCKLINLSIILLDVLNIATKLMDVCVNLIYFWLEFLFNLTYRFFLMLLIFFLICKIFIIVRLFKLNFICFCFFFFRGIIFCFLDILRFRLWNHFILLMYCFIFFRYFRIDVNHLNFIFLTMFFVFQFFSILQLIFFLIDPLIFLFFIILSLAFILFSCLLFYRFLDCYLLFQLFSFHFFTIYFFILFKCISFVRLFYSFLILISKWHKLILTIQVIWKHKWIPKWIFAFIFLY